MNKEIIEHLNILLTHELTSIRQYFLHSAILKSWGIAKLAEKAEQELNDEVTHVKNISDRIMFLGGMPNFQDTNIVSTENIVKGGKTTIKEILEVDLALEVNGIKNLKEAISLAENQKDYATVDLLEHILEEEEGHQDWITKQLKIIELIGAENYLQTQI
ncbi:bacterioferritin [Candidatus Mesenet endosymbiont of Agriotes lineatus]|uniref:bacterioferritin n=1 Tax=Candidatus Mesenet endosymbiont of Agriotes lineatus TaxID=3077948 RepID=UPI0030CB60CB